MTGATHFVGFKDTNQLDQARRVFGEPDFFHRWWDARARDEVFPGDTVVFADQDWDKPVLRAFTYDDSAFF